MEALELTKRQFERLEQHILGREITSTECRLFHVELKTRWKKEEKLLKEYFIQEGRGFSNKLYTINTLIDEKQKIGIDELILPEKLAIVNGKVVGFTMPYVDNVNLHYKLHDHKVSHQDKIRYLKEVGNILNKMHNDRKYNKVDRFFLCDVHEQNFIVNKETDKVNVVDLDSSVIGTAQPSPAKYLATNRNIRNMAGKYPTDGLLNIPNENTDLLCYNLMVLNYIAGTKINAVSADEFYLYLDYLYGLNFKHELIDCFARIYTSNNNKNPDELLDYIPEKMGQASYSVFKVKTLKQKIV